MDETTLWESAPLIDIVDQLESCMFTSEAGGIQMNVAFQELKRRALKELSERA